MESANQNGNIRRAGIWFGIVSILLLPLIFTPFTLDPSLMPRTFIWTIFLIIFIFIGYRAYRKSNSNIDFGILKRLIFPLLISYFIITGVSVFSAINKIEAVTELLRIIPFIVFVGLAAFYFSNFKDSISVITRIVIVFALLQSVIGIIQFVLVLYDFELSHGVTYAISGLSAHRNLYSQILLFSLPFCIYGISIFKKWWKVLAVISAILVLVLIVILLVKSVWMAFVLSLLSGFIFFINYFSHFGYRIKVFRRLGLYFVGIIVVAILSVFVYAKLDSWETIDKQADWIRNYRFGSSLERIDLWEKSVEIYRDNPMRGIGAGNWKIVLPSYGTDGLRSEKGVVNFIRPHNDFLGVLSETGIIGFLIYLAFFVTLFYYGYRIIKSSAANENKLLILLMMSGLLGYIVISLLSFPKERVEHSVFLGIYAVVITVIYHRVFPIEKIKEPKRLKLLLFTILFLLGLSLMSSYYRSESEYHLKKAIAYRSNSEWIGLIEESEKAENLFSVIDNTGIPISWYSGSGYFNMGNIDTALIEFSRAYKYHPNNIHVLNNLAGCYELKGNHKKAIELYEDALKISSGFEDALINLTAVHYNKGDNNSAYRTLRKIDFASKDSRYDRSLELVLKRKFKELVIDSVDLDIKLSLDRIYNDNNWVKKVFGQSLEKNNDFNLQICDDAIYLMEIMDSTITSQRAVILKEKYLRSEK